MLYDHRLVVSGIVQYLNICDRYLFINRDTNLLGLLPSCHMLSLEVIPLDFVVNLVTHVYFWPCDWLVGLMRRDFEGFDFSAVLAAVLSSAVGLKVSTVNRFVRDCDSTASFQFNRFIFDIYLVVENVVPWSECLFSRVAFITYTEVRNGRIEMNFWPVCIHLPPVYLLRIIDNIIVKI